MGDFERTFGAGADAVAIIDGFDRQERRSSSRATPVGGRGSVCGKCGGSGRLSRYKHIDDGKCFDCKGTGKVYAKSAPEPKGASEASIRTRSGSIGPKGVSYPMQPSEHVRLGITLADIEAETPTHDCFGTLTREHVRGLDLLRTSLTRKGSPTTVVSLGDVATAFNPGSAVRYALNIDGIDMRDILGMTLPSAERAARLSGEKGLRTVVAGARYILDTQDALIMRVSGLDQTDLGRTAENSAKRCAGYLRNIARTGAVEGINRTYTKLASMVLVEALDTIVLAAMEAGLDKEEARIEERARQIDDVASVSPLSALS